MKAKLIKKDGHYDLYVESIGLYTSTYQWTSNGNLLSIKNCQAIESGYDLDKLAEEFAKNHSIYPTAQDDTEYGFKHGFQKALELMGNKKFSKENIYEAFSLGEKGDRFELGDLLDSHQQTEWDVEVEMWFHGTRHKKGEWVPKLDADGCLILKRV